MLSTMRKGVGFTFYEGDEEIEMEMSISCWYCPICKHTELDEY
jgi:hypothetical protein